MSDWADDCARALVAAFQEHEGSGRDMRKLVGAALRKARADALDEAIAKAGTWKQYVVIGPPDGRLVSRKTVIRTVIENVDGIIKDIATLKNVGQLPTKDNTHAIRALKDKQP